MSRSTSWPRALLCLTLAGLLPTNRCLKCPETQSCGCLHRNTSDSACQESPKSPCHCSTPHRHNNSDLTIHGKVRRSSQLRHEPMGVSMCGAHDIESREICGRWIPIDQAPEHRLRYDDFSPFIRKPRYSCVELKQKGLSSAESFFFEPCPPNHKEGCQIPTLLQSLAKLRHRRVLACGDSHMLQLFYEMLSLFQSELESVNDTPPPWIPTPISGYDLERYYPENFLKQWRHRLKVDNVSGTFWDAVHSGQARQQGHTILQGHPLSHSQAAKVHKALFRNGFEMWAAYLRDKDPTIKHHEAAACVDLANLVSNRSVDLSVPHKASMRDINAFDVIISNTYVSKDGLVDQLKRHGYRGRVIFIPRFSNGRHGVRTSIPPLAKPNQRTLRAAASDTIKHISGMTIQSIERNLFRLIESRQSDAKASMYPLSYISHNGTKVICMKAVNHGSFRRCEGHAWHACRDVECGLESHFCMPGQSIASY